METQTITPETPVFTDTPLIHVTEAAAGKIRELLSEEGKTESGLRVFVQGGGFTIKNPNATSTCGCGSSFSA